MFELEEKEQEPTNDTKETLRLTGLAKKIAQLCKELEDELCPER